MDDSKDSVSNLELPAQEGINSEPTPTGDSSALSTTTCINSQEDSNALTSTTTELCKNDLVEKVTSLEAELESSRKNLNRMQRLYERSMKYNEDLREQVKHLSSELHDIRTGNNKSDASVQVDIDLLSSTQAEHAAAKVDYGITSSQNLPDLENDATIKTAECNALDDLQQSHTDKSILTDTTAGTTTEQVESMSIADSLKAAAEEAVQLSGFVYDSQSSMYYDYNSGYYYDAERGLYYDSSNGTYIFYDEQTRSYKVHSQVDVKLLSAYYESVNLSQQQQQQWRNNRSKSARSKSPTNNPLVKTYRPNRNEVDEVGGLSTELSRLTINRPRNYAAEYATNAWKPCIRLMVRESEYLQMGSLHLVTCTGGTIGREADQNHIIVIPDPLVSKAHAELLFDEDLNVYTITDFASQNGIYINDTRIGCLKTKSNPHPLSHGDVLKLGSTQFDVHIHPGTETCADCEPGQVMAKLKDMKDSNEERAANLNREVLRRKQLKQIKKKFGLENMAYVDNPNAINTKDYNDKAAERRNTVGSDNPYQKSEAPASVHKAISQTNKGHKMLQKLGWKEGESLGKSQTGISEPVQVNMRVNQQAGLGSSHSQAISLDNVGSGQSTRKMQQWSKARERFDRINSEQTTSDPTTNDDNWISGGTVQDDITTK
ncbi:angiogenic factor with G patch and FHA domains 1-like [Tubulanus polymorphus]|uniref:angiogenic factor with G patch and FHA domains 1-like n=1 Tax=Tubulanus polymorphus TaxID=672921 RepID=UPI003DA3DDEC